MADRPTGKTANHCMLTATARWPNTETFLSIFFLTMGDSYLTKLLNVFQCDFPNKFLSAIYYHYAVAILNATDKIPLLGKNCVRLIVSKESSYCFNESSMNVKLASETFFGNGTVYKPLCPCPLKENADSRGNDWEM